MTTDSPCPPADLGLEDSFSALPESVAAVLRAVGTTDVVTSAEVNQILDLLGEPAGTNVLAKLTSKAAIATTLLAMSGTAALAATGGLPDQAQNGLATAFSHVGIQLPRAGEETPPPRPDTGQPADASSASSADPDANDHGQTVVDVARTDPAEDSPSAKGDSVSEVARGDHGPDTATISVANGRPDAAPSVPPPVSSPPVSVPVASGPPSTPPIPVPPVTTPPVDVPPPTNSIPSTTQHSTPTTPPTPSNG